MKKQILIMMLAAAVLPVFAQETNDVPERPERPDLREDFDGRRDRGDGDGRMAGERYREMTEEQKAEMQKKRIQLMEKTLTDIGVSEEQRAQIKEMQKKHKQDMKAASESVDAARETLRKLEESGTASQEEIFAAIDAVSDAQSEQMKILARNRMQMERLLGKEKFKEFMEAARKQYKKHGRRGGTGMPNKNQRKQEEPVL